MGKFNIKVFYTWGEQSIHVYDPGFSKKRTWDIDLLTGYDHTFVKNISSDPGSHHFKGIINPDLVGQIEEYKPDAILVYGWKFHSHLKLMRYFKGKVPIIFRGDSTLLDVPNGFSVKKCLRQKLLKWVYNHVDEVLSPGVSSDAYFKWAGLAPEKIHRALHAVDNERFMGHNEQKKQIHELETKAFQWRKELGIEINKKVFLFAGKFEPQKDPLILIDAFSSLLKKDSEIHLVLVGDGILKRQIEQSKAWLSNSNAISIVDFQNQSVMPMVYRLGDIFILPSKSETWGLSVNEAMACGKPVIVSDKCGCAQELVQDGINGYTFKSGDLDDLINKMQMIVSKDKLEEMGQASKEIVASFNYQSFAIALDECFRKL